jgi:virulence-associated protein VagC
MRTIKASNSSAVRLTKDVRFNGSEVAVIKREHEIILREVPQNLSRAFKLLTELSADFFAEGRTDAKP